MSFLGAGIGWRAQLSGELPPGLVLEVMPSHFFADPRRLDALAASHPLVFHDVGLSVGTAGTPGEAARERVRRVKALVERAGPLLVSDHLALTVSPGGIDLGHLAPLRYGPDVLEVVAGKVGALQDVLRRPIALENIAKPMVLPGSRWTEGEMLSRLVERTGCGVLLDLTNLLYDARNAGQHAARVLEEYPLEAVVQVHLAGGKRTGGRWVDTHGEPVDAESWRLFESLRGRCPRLITAVVERDRNLPLLADLVADARRASLIWSET